MLKSLPGIALFALAVACAPSMAINPGAAAITAAVADVGRPEADVVRDPFRKPQEMLRFAEIAPSDVVAELIPGGGYFTRLFSKAVGPTGRVFAVIPATNPDRPAPAVRAIAASPDYANVTVIEGPLVRFQSPQPVDLVWTSQNYHDIPPANRALLNTAAFNALKPGGLYVVVDHAAVSGTGPTNTLHRMDEQVARAEIEAAGFVFVEESAVLRNPADDRTIQVFESDMRGRTDQFALKFRRP